MASNDLDGFLTLSAAYCLQLFALTPTWLLSTLSQWFHPFGFQMGSQRIGADVMGQANVLSLVVCADPTIAAPLGARSADPSTVGRSSSTTDIKRAWIPIKPESWGLYEQFI